MKVQLNFFDGDTEVVEMGEPKEFFVFHDRILNHYGKLEYHIRRRHFKRREMYAHYPYGCGARDAEQIRKQVPSWASWGNRYIESLGRVRFAQWYEYFEILDTRRLIDHLEWGNLYHCIEVKHRLEQEDDEKKALEGELKYLRKRQETLENELKVIYERQVAIDATMIREKY